jgi:hypothetical protein
LRLGTTFEQPALNQQAINAHAAGHSEWRLYAPHDACDDC